jgi:hypothetical protein
LYAEKLAAWQWGKLCNGIVRVIKKDLGDGLGMQQHGQEFKAKESNCVLQF